MNNGTQGQMQSNLMFPKTRNFGPVRIMFKKQTPVQFRSTKRRN